MCPSEYRITYSIGGDGGGLEIAEGTEWHSLPQATAAFSTL